MIQRAKLFMGKPWESAGKIMGKHLGNHGKIMGKSWENSWKILETLGNSPIDPDGE